MYDPLHEFSPNCPVLLSALVRLAPIPHEPWLCMSHMLSCAAGVQLSCSPPSERLIGGFRPNRMAEWPRLNPLLQQGWTCQAPPYTTLLLLRRWDGALVILSLSSGTVRADRPSSAAAGALREVPRVHAGCPMLKLHRRRQKPSVLLVLFTVGDALRSGPERPKDDAVLAMFALGWFRVRS